MIYGIYDDRMDTETTISWLRSKKVTKGAMVFCGWDFKERFLIFRGSVLACLVLPWIVFPMALRLRILPHAGFCCSWCKLLPEWGTLSLRGELRLCPVVPISTVLTTMAWLLGVILFKKYLWNFWGVEIGTC